MQELNYKEIAELIGKIVTEKQRAYGNSFKNSSKVLEVLYPDGVSVGQYSNMLAITRIIDKLFRLANDPSAFDESPGIDIAGYGILIAKNTINSRENKCNDCKCESDSQINLYPDDGATYNKIEENE